MSELLPISCISCRTKKIKCNKKNPCNQCIKRSVRCLFPPKFRNVKINEEDLNGSPDYAEQHHHYGEYYDQPSHQQSHQSHQPSHHTSHHTSQPSHHISQPSHHIFQPSHHTSQPSHHISHQNQLYPHIQHNIHQVHHIHDHSTNEKPYHELEHELQLMRTEHTKLLQDNLKLNIELAKHGESTQIKSEEKDLKSPIHITGETTETGEKYYGPQSSSFMIESLKQQKLGSQEVEGSDQPEQTSRKSADETTDGSKNKPYNHPDYHIENSSSSSDSKFTVDFERSINQGSSLESHKSNSLVEQSLSKKHLPILLYSHLKFNDPDLSSDSETFQDLYTLNFNITCKLVDLFFSSNRYYESFISRTKVFEFLDNYHFIKDKEWENDDDLLLFYMIILLSIQKLTPSEFVELNLLGSNSIHQYGKFKTYLSKNILFHNFEKLRHNLLNESIITIQCYILCTEWHFIEQRYEECWSMMFHCCSIAYSIGLHVMGRFRSIKSTSKNTALESETEPKKTQDNDDEENDEEMDISRFKVWFALKNLTGQICSILGRPNPISIQVNSIVLKSSPNSDNTSIFEKNKTETLLKIGLSECLRLSNSMLIENFMIDFTIHDLLQLDSKFEQEIKSLEQFTEGNSYAGSEIQGDSYAGSEIQGDSYAGTKISQGDSYSGSKIDSQGDYLEIDITNVLMDLIILHINKAKLFEPFINKFDKIDEYDLIIKNLVNSILKFLELLNYFIEKFLNSFIEKHFHSPLKGEEMDAHSIESASTTSSNSGKSKMDLGSQRQAMNANLKVGKLFRILFPFLNSFIYQGIIVVFTFLRYRFDDFVKNRDTNTSLINNDFLRLLEINFKALLNFDRRVSGVLKAVTKLWASNISYLINKVLHQIKLIYDKQSHQDNEMSKKRKRQEEAAQEREARYHEQQQRHHQQHLLLQQHLQPQQGEYQQIPMQLSLPPVLETPSNTSQASSMEVVSQTNEDDDSNFGALYGFNLNDPFWLTNPENLPYYISSPSEDGPESTYMEQNFDTNSNKNVSNEVPLMNSSETNSGREHGPKSESMQMPQPVGEIFNIPDLNSAQMNFGNSWGSPQTANTQPQHRGNSLPLQGHNAPVAQSPQQMTQNASSNYGNPIRPPTVISNTFIFGLPYTQGLNFSNSTNISSQLYSNNQQPGPTYLGTSVVQTPNASQSPQVSRMHADSGGTSPSSSAIQGQQPQPQQLHHTQQKTPQDKSRYNHTMY